MCDPWVDTAEVARATGKREAGFAAWMHRYVSSDPSVAIDGTVLPRAVDPGPGERASIVRLAAAAAAATRGRVADLARRGVTRSIFLQLAARRGWTELQPLAGACGMFARGVRKSLRRALPGVHAAVLCLSDVRLLAAYHEEASVWIRARLSW